MGSGMGGETGLRGDLFAGAPVSRKQCRVRQPDISIFFIITAILLHSFLLRVQVAVPVSGLRWLHVIIRIKTTTLGIPSPVTITIAIASVGCMLSFCVMPINIAVMRLVIEKTIVLTAQQGRQSQKNVQHLPTWKAGLGGWQPPLLLQSRHQRREPLRWRFRPWKPEIPNLATCVRTQEILTHQQHQKPHPRDQTSKARAQVQKIKKKQQQQQTQKHWHNLKS